MSITGAAAACCACSTLAEYEETKATAVPEANEAEQKRKFDWQKNSENLRRLAKAEQSEAAQNKDG